MIGFPRVLEGKKSLLEDILVKCIKSSKIFCFGTIVPFLESCTKEIKIYVKTLINALFKR